MIPYHVNNHVNYAFIDPVRCRLESMAARSLRILRAIFAHADVKRLHVFRQFKCIFRYVLLFKFIFLKKILVTKRYDKFVIRLSVV